MKIMGYLVMYKKWNTTRWENIKTFCFFILAWLNQGISLDVSLSSPESFYSSETQHYNPITWHKCSRCAILFLYTDHLKGHFIICINFSLVSPQQFVSRQCKMFSYFLYIICGLECVGHSFANIAHFVFLRNIWIWTQRAAVASRSATNLATHLPS